MNSGVKEDSGASVPRRIMAIALLLLTGCAPLFKRQDGLNRRADRMDLPHAGAIARVSLTVSAAASLQNVLNEIDPLFQQAHPEIEIFYNWGGSGALQRQIERGAPADLFFPASAVQMERLTNRGLVAAQDPAVLGNRLVLVVPLESPLAGFEALRNAEQIAVGEFNTVPAGQYAQATLGALGLLPKLESRLVFFNSVRGVLAAVESGHVAAGLVYETDALLSQRVKVVATAPASAHPPIHYPIAVLRGSAQPEAAKTYMDFLSTPEARRAFERFGFRHPSR